MTRPDPSLLEDLLQFSERAFSALLGTRHEAGTQARSRLEGLARRLDLVGREEFDAAFAMIARARAVQEETLERLARIEKRLGLAAPPPSTPAQPARKKTANRRKTAAPQRRK